MGLKEDYERLSKDGQLDTGPVDEVFVTEWPIVHEYLSNWEVNGQERLLSDIKISKHPEGYSASLQDHQFRRSLTGIGSTMCLAVGNLEHKLCNKRPDWRSWNLTQRKAAILKHLFLPDGNDRQGS